MTEPLSDLKAFFKLESAGGLMLIAAALLALICANTPLSSAYHALWDIPLTVTLGGLGVDKPLHLWVNDGLMAVFFLLVGLEIKREIMGGELASGAQAALPVIAALGGVAVPALIYVWVNQGDALAMRGWAVPTATDIAFALGILALFGSRVPVALKIFLTAVAVMDDLIAIIIIAIFYTVELSPLALTVASACLAVLVALNVAGCRRLGLYLLVGVLLWLAVLKSGVHATLAGVALGLLIPHGRGEGGVHSPLTTVEHALHGFVAFAVLPLFAFANSGLDLRGMSVSDLLHPVPFGVALGLLVGKQCGVFAFSYLAIRLGVARLPQQVNWSQFYAVCVLCGVGFTMSLFIGSLAFDDPQLMAQTRLGVMVGSALSALLACFLLWRCLPKAP